MNIVIAIDSFKGSLSSIEAGEAVKAGALKAFPDANISVCPLADGGEGTVDAIIEGLNAKVRTLTVCDPLGDKAEAYYGITPDGIAVMEMAKAAGITMIAADKRNPMLTTTYGVGEMIKDAILLGCREFIIGIGGSATNDGGIGMLQALGFSFKDKNGNEVPYGAYGVSLIDSVDISGALKEIKECKFHIACDVTNPLCGKNGCSHVYSRQKGADDEMIEKMDTYLENYANITEKALNISTKEAEGAGAAGGLGFAFISYLNASLEKGIKLIIEKTGLEEKIKGADLVVTGEGRLDFQTAMGKAPVGVAEIAQKHGVTTIAFAGCVTNDAGECNNHGIKAFFPILREICTLDKAMDKEYARNNLEKTAEQVFRLMK